MTSFAIKICISILALCVAVCRKVLRIFLSIYYAGKKRTVPPIKNPILLKSAVQITSDIREGKIKCEDVVKAYISRIRQVNVYINAIAEERFEVALKEAKEYDNMIASGSKSIQQLQQELPLLGVPFTVKFLIAVEGVAFNIGSPLHMGKIAKEDAEVVALMKKAGAICMATTNGPELGLHVESYNTVYGWTSNPYDTTRTAGGSSGGEGAIIGAGASLVGIGNDLAGSIRIPGHFNGIFGHKPTVGLINNEGIFPKPASMALDEMISTGPMCRYAEDLILTMKILSGKNAKRIKTDAMVNFSVTNVYYFAKGNGDPFAQNISPEIRDIVLNAVAHFQDNHGSKVQEIDFKELKAILPVYFSSLMIAVESKLLKMIAYDKHQLNPVIELIKFLFGLSKLPVFVILGINVNKWIMRYLYYSQRNTARYLDEVEKKLNKMLVGNSVLIMPTYPHEAFYHRELFPFLLPNIFYTPLFNILGFPGTQCPIKLNKRHLPIGLQIVSAKGQDHLTIACAMELQRKFGGWQQPNVKE